MSNTTSYPVNIPTSNSQRHRQKLQQLNVLEHNLVTKSIEKRRKIVSLIYDEHAMPIHRKTLARAFISASYEKYDEPITKSAVMTTYVPDKKAMQQAMAMTATGFMFQPLALQNMPKVKKTSLTARQVRGKWTLIVQGRLLIVDNEENGSGSSNVVSSSATSSMDDSQDQIEEGADDVTKDDQNSRPTMFAHLFDAIKIKPKQGDEIEWKKGMDQGCDVYAFSIEIDDHYSSNTSDLPVDIEFYASTPENYEFLPSAGLMKVLFPTMGKAVPVTTIQVHDNLYRYILKHRLQDPSDFSVINNNSTLESLFGCKRMQFSAVSQLLTSKSLLLPLSGGENSLHATKVTVMLKRGQNTPNLAEVDVEVFSTVQFHERARALLQRIKKRELEYTSSRNKASRMLSASHSEDFVKKSIERCVADDNSATIFDVQTILALAKGSPEDSEAQRNAHIDARLISLWNRIEAHSRLSRQNRKVLDIIMGKRKFKDVEKDNNIRDDGV